MSELSLGFIAYNHISSPLESTERNNLWMNYWMLYYTLPSLKPELPDEEDHILVDISVGAETMLGVELENDWV